MLFSSGMVILCASLCEINFIQTFRVTEVAPGCTSVTNAMYIFYLSFINILHQFVYKILAGWC